MTAFAKSLRFGIIYVFAVTLRRLFDLSLASKREGCRSLNLNGILAATLLTLGAAPTYAAPLITIVVDKPYSASNDPEVTPALQVTGTWDLSTPGDTQVISLVNWGVTLETKVQEVSGNLLYVVSVKGQHLVPSPSLDQFAATIGTINEEGVSGGVSSYENHIPPGDGDYWIFKTNIDQKGTMSFSVLASHQIDNNIPIAISLAPSSAALPVGATHTLSATVVDVSDNPIPNVVVTFTVLSGPNAGVTGQRTTDANGVATFNYPGSGGDGIDTIQASFDGGLGVIDSNIVAAAWRIEATGVPAISPFGLVILSVLLGLFGSLGMRRRK